MLASSCSMFLIWCILEYHISTVLYCMQMPSSASYSCLFPWVGRFFTILFGWVNFTSRSIPNLNVKVVLKQGHARRIFWTLSVISRKQRLHESLLLVSPAPGLWQGAMKKSVSLPVTIGHPTCLGLIRLMGRSWWKLMYITFGPDIERVENVLQALLAHMSHLWPQSYIHKVERPWSILWWKTLVICLLRNIFGWDSLPFFVPFVFFMHIYM